MSDRKRTLVVAGLIVRDGHVLIMQRGPVQKQPELAYLQNMGTEQKNGQNAVHLHADQNTPLPAGSSPIPAGTLFDMWVAADGGYLVALEATGLLSTDATVGSIQIELTNVNDPTLKIEAPA